MISSKIINVLIIDDHQIIIDTYRNALNEIEKTTSNIIFKSLEAKNCDSAIKIIEKENLKETFSLVFLDIQLPSSESSILSGEGLGIKIRESNSKAKIIVCTNINDNHRLNNILKTVNPDGLLVKSDITFKDLLVSIRDVLSNKTYYSQSIINLLRLRAANDLVLDDYDVKILREISNGAKMKELLEIIPLSKSGIEKRKRLIKEAFKLKHNTDRELILAAKKRGYIWFMQIAYFK